MKQEIEFTFYFKTGAKPSRYPNHYNKPSQKQQPWHQELYSV